MIRQGDGAQANYRRSETLPFIRHDDQYLDLFMMKISLSITKHGASINSLFLLFCTGSGPEESQPSLVHEKWPPNYFYGYACGSRGVM